MKVILARPRGFCAGVQRALELVDVALARFGAPLFVRREIVHNSYVVARLRERGAVFVEDLDQVPEGSRVVFSAHGVAPSVREEAARRGLTPLDATCPLVEKVHREAVRYAARGYQLALIGHRDHDEVIGTRGCAPEAITVVGSAEEAAACALSEDAPLMALTQTTISVDDAARIVDALRARFPRLEQPPAADICYATQSRQDALKQLAPRIDALLVVGSPSSSNARRLVEVGRESGVDDCRLIDSAGEIDPDRLTGVSALGVTSGASTPELLVEEVVGRLRASGATEVEELVAAEENVRFPLPAELIDP